MPTIERLNLAIPHHSSSHHVYSLLLAAWTAICVGFWSAIYLGGDAMTWAMTQYFGLARHETESVLHMFHNVPVLGAIMIWLMGAAMLLILRWWMHAVATGPDAPRNDLHFKNDGKLVE